MFASEFNNLVSPTT